MIKNYLALNQNEKLVLVKFIKEKTNVKEKDIIESLESEVYNFGEGIFIYIKEGIINSCLSVVLELVEKNNVVYIHKVICDNKHVLNELIKFSVDYIENKYLVKEIYLASTNELTLSLLKEIGYQKDYSSYRMKLKNERLDEKIIDIETLKLENLNLENIDEYEEVYEKSFLDMPHGTYRNKEDLKEYLYKENYRCFLVKESNKTIGFCEIDIKDNNRAYFDLGLIKEFRGRGYGTKLLDTIIINIKESGIKNICLIVIEKNNIALNLYKKRGFEIFEKISDWIVIK